MRAELECFRGRKSMSMIYKELKNNLLPIMCGAWPLNKDIAGFAGWAVGENIWHPQTAPTRPH
jgi:hypothetical protein